MAERAGGSRRRESTSAWDEPLRGGFNAPALGVDWGDNRWLNAQVVRVVAYASRP